MGLEDVSSMLRGAIQGMAFILAWRWCRAISEPKRTKRRFAVGALGIALLLGLLGRADDDFKARILPAPAGAKITSRVVVEHLFDAEVVVVGVTPGGGSAVTERHFGRGVGGFIFMLAVMSALYYAMIAMVVRWQNSRDANRLADPGFPLIVGEKPPGA